MNQFHRMTKTTGYSNIKVNLLMGGKTADEYKGKIKKIAGGIGAAVAGAIGWKIKHSLKRKDNFEKVTLL